MVVFVDLEDDSEPPERRSKRQNLHWSKAEEANVDTERNVGGGVDNHDGGVEARMNPNINPMTEAMGCYPIITSIASHLDLNTLDNLARTCRQMRSNLLQFRTQLMIRTLRCSNEEAIPNRDHTLRYRARAADWYFVEPDGARVVGEGKVGDCARDLVGDCRRCGKIVCRNCTIKPPAPVLLAHRHRRLCPTCIHAPISKLIGPSLPTAPITLSFSSSKSLLDPHLAVLVCTCPTEGVYLCQPCGRGLRSADTTYDSIWRWISRYGGAAAGGLGTGLGDGNRSFVCGREKACLAARWIEEEIDCDAEDAREIESRSTSSFREADLSTFSTSPSGSASSFGSTSPGYLRHEIEGIGGVVKKKLVRMVKVGACVTEWADEKEGGRHLTREREGKTRSWCGWCWRVVPGEKDLKS